MGQENWEGEVPAEPKRQRMANGETAIFLEGSALALRTQHSKFGLTRVSPALCTIFCVLALMHTCTHIG